MSCLMGCTCAKDKKSLENFDVYFPKFNDLRHLKSQQQNDSNNYQHIAVALLKANRAASLVVHEVCPGLLTQDAADQLIRKAKNDGQTVSFVNGCLYIDYKFAGFMSV